MEGQFFLQCPYCDKVHAGKVAVNRVTSPENGVLNVLSTLPCGNKIVLFFSNNRQLRGHQVIDEINVVDYDDDKLSIIPSRKSDNYNDNYNRMALKTGMQARVKKV